MKQDPNAQWNHAINNVTGIIDSLGSRIHPQLGAQLAQVQATLALVAEQRSANLIAYERLCLEVNASPHISDKPNYLPAEIRERLGL